MVGRETDSWRGKWDRQEEEEEGGDAEDAPAKHQQAGGGRLQHEDEMKLV